MGGKSRFVWHDFMAADLAAAKRFYGELFGWSFQPGDHGYEHIAAAELMPLREWLRDRIHRHGGKFTSAELVERVVGGPVLVAPFVRYLKRKLSDVYGARL